VTAAVLAARTRCVVCDGGTAEVDAEVAQGRVRVRTASARGEVPHVTEVALTPTEARLVALALMDAANDVAMAAEADR
jgi:hypothetical protein